MNITYELRENEYGKGIYVLEHIKENTCIWTYKLNNNVFEFSEKESISYLENLPNLKEQQRFLDVTFGKGDKLCLITDNCYAIRDIKKDEEILEDYSSYTHPPFLFPLLKKYNCEPTYYTMDNL